MSTARSILRFFRKPDSPADLIFRSSLVFHVVLGCIPLALFPSPSVVVLFMAFLVSQITALVAALMVFGVAHAFWRWNIKRRISGERFNDPDWRFDWAVHEEQTRSVGKAALALEAESALTLAKQIRYLLPGLVIVWSSLFLLGFFLTATSR